MKDAKAVSRMLIVGILIVVIVIAGAAGYFLTRPKPAVKDTLIMGTTDSVETTLDPANAYDYFGEEIISSLSSPLVTYKPGATGVASDIVPALATSWSVSSDGLHWTFNLRQGVKYDDGTEFNATDVKFTFDRGMGIADPDGSFVGIGYSDIIDSITVVSKYVVEFNLKIPFGAFLSLMAYQDSYMVDPKYGPMHGTSWNESDVVQYVAGNPRASNPMGLGPYTLKSWTRVAGKDTSMELTADPNYWDTGYPQTKNIIINFYADSADLALAITSGAVDMAYRQLAPTDITSMRSNTNLKVWNGPGLIQYLCFQEKYAPFNDVHVRQAVAAAVNRTALVQTVFQGNAKELYSMIPIGMLGHTDAFQTLGDANYSYTKQVLASLGYNANNKLAFTLYYETSGHYALSAEQALVLKSSLEASGVISVTLSGLDWAAYGNARRAETMQAYIMGWYPDYIDPDDYIFPFLHSGAAGNSWLHENYADPTMDTLIEWARANTTDTARTSLYGQINNLMVQDCPTVPLFQGYAYAVTKTNVQGIYLDASQMWRHWLISATA
jgi:peptide/nickel transport system substrate-binding protein